MRSVYQIPGHLLEAHVARLRKSPAVQSCEGVLHACLFLTGLRVTWDYYRAARAGSEFFTNWSPNHHLDNGIEIMARRCLKLLVCEARSRDMKEDMKIMFPNGAPNPNLLAVELSFANLLSHAPKTVLTWISPGDATENKASTPGCGISAAHRQLRCGFRTCQPMRPTHSSSCYRSRLCLMAGRTLIRLWTTHSGISVAMLQSELARCHHC
jgi:hypothetical protein